MRGRDRPPRGAGRGPGLAFRSALIASEGALQRFAFAEALSWLDLASAVAGGRAETEEVDRRTAALMELAGWSEVPPGRAGGRRSPGRSWGRIWICRCGAEAG